MAELGDRHRGDGEAKILRFARLPRPDPEKPGGHLAAILELPRIKLTDEAALLFAKYFSREANASERKALASFLLAPTKIDIAAEQDPIEKKYALDNLQISALRALVAIENDLHQSGTCSKLSSVLELSQLLGLSEKKIRDHLRFLPREDAKYRERELHGYKLEEARQKIVNQVRAELENYKPAAVLTSDEEISQKLAISPVAALHLVLSHLSHEFKTLRTFALRTAGRTGAHLAAPLALVRAELAAFNKGEIERLHSDTELAAMFGTSLLIIENELAAEGIGLNPEEKRARQFILTLQQPQDPASRAARRIVFEGQQKKIEAAWPLPKLPGLARREPAIAKQGRIHFRGNWFDSIEEAACAQLLEKYLEGFALVRGETLQVAVGSKFVDFKIGEVFVEYHPIALYKDKSGRGGFASFEDYFSYLQKREGLSLKDRQELVEATKIELARDYQAAREQVIAASPEHRGRKLILATTPEEFFERVVSFFNPYEVTQAQFMREFSALKRRIKIENGRGSNYELERVEQRERKRRRVA